MCVPVGNSEREGAPRVLAAALAISSWGTGFGFRSFQHSTNIDSFVSSRDINYEIVRNTESLDRAFGPVHYIPTIVVLDRDGKVQKRYTGLVGKNVLRNQIETLLAKPT